jgi:hypothetical protein
MFGGSTDINVARRVATPTCIDAMTEWFAAERCLARPTEVTVAG